MRAQGHSVATLSTVKFPSATSRDGRSPRLATSFLTAKRTDLPEGLSLWLRRDEQHAEFGGIRDDPLDGLLAARGHR